MANQEDRNERTVTVEATGGGRKRWTSPVVERQGSVAELVQIVKQSGSFDCSGTKRNGPPSSC